MSQIEILMLVALGFVLALLLVFIFGRTVWSASDLYARRKREKDMPAAMLEIQAERDRLRADNARMARKLEVGTDSMRAQVITQQAEVSRHRNRLLNMTETYNEHVQSLAEKSAENIDLKDQVSQLSLELANQEKLIKQMRDELDLMTAATQQAGQQLPPPKRHTQSTKPIVGKTEPALLPLPEPEPAIDEYPEALAAQKFMNEDPANDDQSDTPPEPEIPVKLDVPNPGEAIQAPRLRRPNRFSFERRPLSPGMERTIHGGVPPDLQSELPNDDVVQVITEARRTMAVDDFHASDTRKNGAKSPSETVLGLAQRIRDIQKKSDAKVNKTLK